MSVRHTSNSLEHRGVKQADSKSNTQIPKIEEATHFPQLNPDHPMQIRYGIQSHPRTNSSKSGSPRIATRQARSGPRIPPVRRGNHPSGGRGSGGELEKLPSSRATADGVSSPFSSSSSSWWRTRRRFCQHGAQGGGRG
jgi:hypothetical protein